MTTPTRHTAPHRFRTVARASLIDMLRSRTLRIAAALILTVVPVLAIWLRTSNQATDLLARAGKPGTNTSLRPDQRGLIVSMLVLFTVYVFILACGSIITTSVALERTSRVSVMVFRHVSPLTVVAARLTSLMIAMLGLVACVAVEVTAVAALGVLPVGGLASMLGLTSLSVAQWLLAVVCASGGVIIFSVLYAAVGLFVKEPSQLQYAQFPVSFVLILVFVVSYVAVLNPASRIASIAALFPLSAPMIESGRIIAGQASAIEPWGAAAGVVTILAVTAVVIARIIVPRTVGTYRATNETMAARPAHRHH